MKIVRCGFPVLLFLAWLPLAALGDGKVFPPMAVPAHVEIPDQQALIHFTNGMERLVIQTRFSGEGTNFAWVVPLPAVPNVEAASPGLFPTLEYLFRPEIKHKITPWYLVVLAFLGLAYLLVSVKRGQPLSFLDVVACGLVIASSALLSPAAGIFGGALLLVALVMVRCNREPVYIILVLTLMGFLLAAMLLPALASPKARGGATGAGDGVEILEHKLVGVYDTTTIAAKEPNALSAWLAENGYAMPTNAAPVIGAYVKEGWVFVAARIRRDLSQHSISAPHPLSFTFQTPKPVYPMRLTGLDNGPLKVVLYVFGSASATAPGFTVDLCTHPSYPSLSGDWRWSTPNELPIVHPLMRQWVGLAPVATRLSATLQPSEMQKDIWLEWRGFSEARRIVYSHEGARIWAFNWAGAVLAAGILCVWFVIPRRLLARSLPGAIWTVAIVAIVTGLIVYLTVPRIEVRLLRGRQVMSVSRHLLMTLGDELEFATNRASLAEAKAILQATMNQPPSYGSNWENPFLGGRIREEDSPGNYLLRPTTNGYEFLIYDPRGAEIISAPLR
jgi:hypothetical protein